MKTLMRLVPETYQVQSTTWRSLVLAMLVEEKQAFTGLASPGGSRACGLLALQKICLELR
jgi:hypothetical protein